MGKLVIVLVAVGAAVAMIMQFSSDIDNSIPKPGQDDKKNLEIITVSGTQQQKISKISDLISLCYSRSLDRGYESFSCFVVRKSSGTFNIPVEDIKSSLKEEVLQKTSFKISKIDSGSVIIAYNVESGKVVVKE